MRIELEPSVEAWRHASRLLDVEAPQHAERAGDRRLVRETESHRGRIGDAFLIEANGRLDHVLETDSDREPAHPRSVEAERQRRHHPHSEIGADPAARASGDLLAPQLEGSAETPRRAHRASVGESDLRLAAAEILVGDRVAIVAAFDA